MDDVKDPDEIIEPGEDDLKKGSLPLNDGDEPDELMEEEDDLLDPLLGGKKMLDDDTESLDDLADAEDEEDDLADEDEW